MKRPTATRALRFTERHWPWLVAGALVSGGLCALVFFISTGLLESIDPIRLGRNVRGYTLPGIAMGILAVILSALAFAYSFRKRSLQERLPLRGTMMMWLWAHVYLGLLALLAATLHGGYGVISLTVSTGKILFVIFALLVFSGLAWRLVYRFVPAAAGPQIRNYSQSDSLDRAQQQLVEIEKIAAGKSAQLRQVKDWIITGARKSRELETAIAMLPFDDGPAVAEIQRLAASRTRALRRHRLQARYHRILQGWRLLHIPMVGAFGVVFVIHLVAAFDLPSRLFPARFDGFPSAQECATCHQEITEQWQNSMHAHAITSPVTIVQTNQVIADTVAGQPSPDPFLFCNNCHAPVGTKLTDQGTLPLEPPFPISDEAINEGINCSTCHQYTGEPASGSGGLARVFQEALQPGGLFFSAIDDPVGNAYHRSGTAPAFEAPEALCQNCHNVNYDRNDDGLIEPGVDLILQTTYDEFVDYQEEGGGDTCITCHMPLLAQDRAAEAADIPLQQDFQAPAREVHDHSFVGVDYPLDTVSAEDPQRDAREELLRSAAAISIDNNSVQISEDGSAITFAVDITNVGAGHQLPTGFAFARQMWLEVTVTDLNGRVLLTSGVLADNVSDLCDQGTLADALADFVEDCPEGVDAQLVNFQQKLLDVIDIKRDENGEPVLNEDGEFIIVQGVDGEETWLQHLTGGAVARVRPSDGQLLARIFPFETRTFVYSIPFNGELPDGITISVRLLFRNLPPYFLRVLAANQPPDEIPRIAPIIENLQIVEMDTVVETFIRSGSEW